MLQDCFSYITVSICVNLHQIKVNMYKELFNANKNLRYWIIGSPTPLKIPVTSWRYTDTNMYLKRCLQHIYVLFVVTLTEIIQDLFPLAYTCEHTAVSSAGWLALAAGVRHVYFKDLISEE